MYVIIKYIYIKQGILFFPFQISVIMSIKLPFDSPNDVDLLDLIDGLTLPLYNHYQYGDPYPPVGYDHSQPRVRYTTTEPFMKKTRVYVLDRNVYIKLFYLHIPLY